MDGVLVDNKEAHIEAFVTFCALHGIDIKGMDLSWMYGKGNDEIIPRLLPGHIIEEYGIKALGDEKEAVYRKAYAPAMQPVPGLVPFLEDLYANNVTIAVGSSAPVENVNFVLDGLGIRKYFSVFVNGDMVHRAKPDPAIYLLSLEKLGLPASECLVMEDSFAGIESANGAGIKVVALATTNTAEALSEAKVEMIVPDFTSLSYQKIAGL